ncbi:hypothetical protein [Aliiroseovarius subalbicans]|uniref:hypothetical protein n=1 Tax=Aliiroseovarius subalbicans TaxID=2925840 RepID=UPI001F572964|nr:hypothetical protein [Aliiroseovarius subalbicans]MCI2399565.1 hypothetical protein [Aliiroseovarius subalbicans]
MSEPKQEPAVDLGVYGKGAGEPRLGPGEMIALALSAVWLVGCAVFFLVLGDGDGTGTGVVADPLRLVMTALAIFMPVAIIWVATAATRSARIMREESARLHATIEAMRHTYLQQQQAGGVKPSTVEKKLEEIAQAQKQTETAIATFTSIRPPSPTQMSTHTAIASDLDTSDAIDQGSLALGTPAEALSQPLSVEDFIRAMHFPENAEDAEGFRALRRALQDRQVSGLVQAAQDVLTLLSQDGIYMDDLRPDRARPEIWRQFAAGERGRAIAPLGGVRDRSSLALSAGRMRKDPIFRDAVHHFLRKFDQTFSGFEKNATDQEIAAMSDTRTARAFMLLGRVTGTFD